MNRARPDLARSSFTGVLWNAATFGLSKLVVLVTTIILARLLVPTDFGLLAIGLVVIGYLDFVNDFGISSALIQHDGDPDETGDTAFWINIALGVALALVGFALAPLVASFFAEPRATSIIRVLSLSFPLRSIGSIHEARLRRDLRFARRVFPELLKGASKGAVAITLALLGHGVWSLVWGQLTGTAVAAIAYWFACPWIPALRFRRDTARQLVGFGASMTLVGLLGGLNKNVDYLVVGRQLGPRQLGLYTMAFRLPQLLIESVVDITGQVAFPAFSRVRHDPQRVQAGLQRMLGMIGVVVVPLGLGLALTADPFVRIFYGERWIDAIPVMQVLAIYTLMQSLGKTCGDVYKAMGRPGVLSRLSIARLVVTVPLLILAVPHGIVPVALALLASAAVFTVVRLWIAARIVELPFAAVVRPFVPAVRAGAVMTAVCLVVITVTESAGSPALLLGTTSVGAVVYAATLWTFDRDQLETYRQLAGRRPSATAAGVERETTP